MLSFFYTFPYINIRMYIPIWLRSHPKYISSCFVSIILFSQHFYFFFFAGERAKIIVY